MEVVVILDLCVVFGRALIGAMFLWGAIDKLLHWEATKALCKQKKIIHPDMTLPLSIGCRLVGGILVLFGFFVSIGSGLLLLVKLSTLLPFYSFWKYRGEEKRLVEHKFMKEVIIIGALFILFAIGLGY